VTLASPPFEPLAEVVGRLEDRGLVCALGGSGLLAALGLVGEVGDWDLTTDAGGDEVAAALGGRGFERFGASGVHADSKLVLEGGMIEVISRFAMRSGDDIVRLPTIVTGRWRGVPLGSPEVWAVAYHLLGREARTETVLAHLDRTGADPEALERLLGAALPAALKRRLEALPRRSGRGSEGGG
jgi:hypothetical protein